MHAKTRLMSIFAVAALALFVAACGGQPEPAPTPEKAPEPEAAPAPATPAEPEQVEPPPPTQPQLQGNIVDLNLTPTLEWLSAATRENPGKYRWTVGLRNDTTQTLDITVKFDFLNVDEQIIKTDRKTMRVAPAESVTVTNEGEMNRDNARVVEFTSYTYDWKIVED